MPAAAIGITGATGRLGRKVAERLARAGVTQRLIVRDGARAPALPSAQVSVATYDDPAALAAALAEIETLFFVSASESPRRLDQHFTLIRSAASARVRHIVYTSFFGAAPNATFTLARDHWATEQRLRETDMAVTFLRDNLYLDFFPMMVGQDNAIRGPAGQGRVAAVAQDDIADVAAAVLQHPPAHADRTYELTGPEALTLAGVAEALSRHFGREIRYVAETLDEAYRSRAMYDAEKWQIDAWVSTYRAIAAGELERVTPDVERVSGHPPMSLERVLSGSIR
jgi:uncharacterized protein YbjT (DUF2867 family)